MSHTPQIISVALAATLASLGAAQAQDVVHPGNVIIGGTLYVQDDSVLDGNVCIGNTCSIVETFAIDETVRLKYTQLSIQFIDTSSASNPDRDWTLRINDTSTGGVERFSVEDDTAGTTPFTIEGGGPDNALWIEDDGDVGFGTVAPDYPLHVKRSDGTAIFKVEETSTGAGNLSMMFLDNVGGRARMQMKGAGNPGQTGDWSISAGNTFVLQERISANNVMIVDATGNVTLTGSLTTAGGVTPDYVFAPDYDLMPLDEVGAFIVENRHLPKIPSAAEIGASGLNMTEMQMALLEKVEELTLYTLEQQKTIKALEQRLDQLSGE